MSIVKRNNRSHSKHTDGSFHGKTGVITVTRKGLGFVDLGYGEDILIRPEHVGTAMSGDMVSISAAGYERGTPAGKVEKVIARARNQFVGTLYEEGGMWYLRPDEKRVFTPLKIVEGETKPNYKAMVSFIDWVEGEPNPTARVRELIGKAGDHETEMRAFVLRSGFEMSFPPDVADAARVLEETGRDLMKSGIDGRRDMRGITTFTIDPKDAKDFDDAISYQVLPEGTIEVGVHIADVSYFVQPGDALDKEARRRATSIYLVDRTIPMLPEILSNDLCSLRPNEDRLALSAIFTMTHDGEVLDVWFGETVIHSDKRFTYEEAQEVLDAGEGLLFDELTTLSGIAQRLRKSRYDKGSVSFDSQEVKVEVDETGKPVRIYLKERKETNLLIEDLMLLANEAVAARMQKVTKENGESFIYRIHDLPDAEKIYDLSSFLKALGYELPTDRAVTGKDLNALFKKIEGTPEEFLIKTSAIRSMAKAEYTTRNIGHFGLAMKTYTHFTSPIRRYPDLLVHRLLKAHLHHTPWGSHQLAQLEEDARHATEREIAAAEAERDSVKLKQVEWMAAHVGKVFDGVISGVSERGVFITEKTTRSDGFVAIRNIGDDYYSYDEKKYQLIGSKTGTTYRLGDEVRVKLVKADPTERTLDFVFVSE